MVSYYRYVQNLLFILFKLYRDSLGMSGIWGTLITGTNLAASISELERLNPVPHIPKEHDLLVSSSDRKHLSLQWERQIVNNLAFISATTKDPSRVMAVAVEESLETESMVIRLTSNTGDLSHIVKEFQDLAGILMQAARRGEVQDGFSRRR